MTINIDKLFSAMRSTCRAAGYDKGAVSFPLTEAEQAALLALPLEVLAAGFSSDGTKGELDKIRLAGLVFRNAMASRNPKNGESWKPGLSVPYGWDVTGRLANLLVSEIRLARKAGREESPNQGPGRPRRRTLEEVAAQAAQAPPPPAAKSSNPAPATGKAAIAAAVTKALVSAGVTDPAIIAASVAAATK